MTQQQPGLRSKEYVRKLPRLTQEQIIAAPRQQAIQEADPSYSGHYAGIHPEHRPYVTDDYDLEEGDEYYQTRLPTSSRRYHASPEEVYQSGNTRYHVRYVDIPKRKSRQQQLPPLQQQERYTDEVAALPKAKHHKRRIHPLVYLGVGM